MNINKIPFKICKNCGIEKKKDSFSLWSRVMKGKEFFSHKRECKDCENKSTKICTKCKIEKNIDLFSLVYCKGRRPARKPSCKECYCKQASIRFKNTPKVILRERSKKYRLTHKAQKAVYDRRWRLKNKEKKKQTDYLYRKNNREAVLITKRKYTSLPHVKKKLREKSRKEKEELSNNYIIQCNTRNPLLRDALRNNPQLIESMRQLIKLKRLIKQRESVNK